MSYPTTFLDLQNAVIAKGRLDATADLAKVKDWLNATYADLCSQARLYESSGTATLSANASTATIPTTLVTMEYVVVTSGGVTYGPMEQVPFEEILRMRAFSSGTSTNSVPTHFARRYTTIEIWPNAAGGETLTFYGDLLPTALAGDTDQPIIPEPYRKAIEYGAICEAVEFKRDTDILQYFQTKSVEWQRRLIGFVNRRAGATTQQMAVLGTPSVAPHDPSTDLG